jgi:hypothetical protein
MSEENPNAFPADRLDRGGFMTKPVWGKRARPPRGFDESQE